MSRAAPVVAATLGFMVAAALLMWPVLGAPHERVYGQPSDPLGEVWRLDQFRVGEIALVGDPLSTDANVPGGVELRRVIDITQALYDLPSVALVQVMPAVPAYNLMVWVALWSSGLVTLLALTRIGVRWEAAALAGALFMLAPVHMAEAGLHVGLALTAPLPVLLALGVAVLRRPRVRLGAAYGVVAGVSAYVTAYHSLLVLALSAGVVAAAAGVAVARPRRRAALGRAVAAAAGAAAVTLVPLAVALASSKGTIDDAVGRPEEDIATFSLDPGDLVDRDLTSYVGLAGAALALAGAVWGRGGRTLRATLVAVTLSGLLFATSPDAPVVGPLAPAGWIHDLLPYWRVYGRAEVVAALGIACLAGLAVARLAERPAPAARVAAAVLAAVAVLDVVREPPPVAADLGAPDPRADWLRGSRAAVAELPAYGFENFRLGPYLLRQTRHGRPLMNGAIEGTASADLTEAVGADGGRQALAALRIAGVDRVVAGDGAALPPGLRPGPALGDGTRGGSVPPGPGAIALARGPYPAEPGPGGAEFRWLADGSVLRVRSSCAGGVRVSFTAVSHTGPRTLLVAGRRIPVPTAPTPVSVTVPAGGAAAPRDVVVTTDPPAAALPGGDPRVAGVGVYGLRAVPVCAGG